MSALEAIECDRCGETRVFEKGSGQTSWGVIRKLIAKDGWHTVRKTGEPVRDICPTCWKVGLR